MPDRPYSFPFDWLGPGERRYCSAGRHLVAGAKCGLCWASHGDVPVPPDERQAAAQVHETIRTQTERRAWERLEAGVPPLFWMGV